MALGGAHILVFKSVTGGVWSLMEWMIAPAEILGTPDFGPRCHHRCEETFIVRGGRLDFLLGEMLFHLDAGDAIRDGPRVRHGSKPM